MYPQIDHWATLALNAHIYIREVKGNKIKSKRRPIFLMELGNNTICFLSDLDIPKLPNVVFGFDIEDSNSQVTLLGKIETKGMYEEMFQYRVKLHNLKEHQIYNTSLLRTMLSNLNYFMFSKNKMAMRRNINQLI